MPLLGIFVCPVHWSAGDHQKYFSNNDGGSQAASCHLIFEQLGAERSGELRQEPAGPGLDWVQAKTCPSSSATGYEIKSSRGRAEQCREHYQDHTSLPTFNISHGVWRRGVGLQMLMKVNKALCYIILSIDHIDNVETQRARPRQDRLWLVRGGKLAKSSTSSVLRTDIQTREIQY